MPAFEEMDGLVLPPKVTHVIFDLDGLLINTEPIHTKAFTKVCEEYGKEYTMDLKARSMGMTHDATIAYVIKDLGLSDAVTVREFAVHFDRCLEEMLPDNEMLPGALKLVRHFAAHNVPMALCSGSTSFEFEWKMKNHQELLELISLRVMTGDDPEVKHGKPAPDGFLVTMGRFDKKPKSPVNVVVFEDSPNGVLAAVAAGMHVVMVPDLSFTSPPKAVLDKISFVLSSLEEFKPETLGLPAY